MIFKVRVNACGMLSLEKRRWWEVHKDYLPVKEQLPCGKNILWCAKMGSVKGVIERELLAQCKKEFRNNQSYGKEELGGLETEWFLCH